MIQNYFKQASRLKYLSQEFMLMFNFINYLSTFIEDDEYYQIIRCIMQKQECQTMSYPTEQPIIEEQQIYFVIDRKIISVVFLAFSFLYMSLEQHRARYFVYISIATNIIYPLLRIQKHPQITLKKIILQGTIITSLLYDIWTLFYPHKVFIYYIPQLVGAVGKIYHLLTYDRGSDQDVVEQLIKFQSKTQALVLVYSLLTFLLRLKYSWWKLLKLLLLLSILRLKYSLHYGTRISVRQMHFTIDNYTKYISLRQYYQTLYLKLSRLCGEQRYGRQDQQIIF